MRITVLRSLQHGAYGWLVRTTLKKQRKWSQWFLEEGEARAFGRLLKAGLTTDEAFQALEDHGRTPLVARKPEGADR